MRSKKGQCQTQKDKGFTLIEVLIVVAIIGILASFLLPNIVQAHYKGRASRIASDLRIIRDTLLRYHMEKNSWPRSRSWGRMPPEFRSYLPAGALFNIPGWETSLAFTNYSNKSDKWVDKRGYRVVIRVRIKNIMLANKVYRMAPNLFSRVGINKKRGIFFLALE
jgi:prepilin-type N-terminal cleavage/methylation domain-containing protein